MGPLQKLDVLTAAMQCACYGLAGLTNLFPLFDASPKVDPNSSFLLRWDSFHFQHIAQEGYVYEYEWAFFPGAPLVTRWVGMLPAYWRSPVLALGLLILACRTTRTLYLLSLHHLGNPTLAFLTALLSLMPSSPPTLRMSLYAEPFFTYFSYNGRSSHSHKDHGLMVTRNACKC